MLDNLENRFGNIVNFINKCLFGTLLKMFFHDMRELVGTESAKYNILYKFGKTNFLTIFFSRFKLS